MSAALDSLPLVGAFGAVCGAAGTAFGKWYEGRSKERTAKTEADASVAVAGQETERAAIAHDAAVAPQLLKRIEALEAHVTRLDKAVADCGDEKHGLARERDDAVARAVLAEREVTLQSARADLAEMAAHDAQTELARWRDQSGATD